MEEHIAEKAKELLFKIRNTKDKIEKLSDMQRWDFRLCTCHHSEGILIPAELQETVYMLVNTTYENELNKLENELKEL